MHHRFGPKVVATTLILGGLLVAAFAIYALITPHITPELLALGIGGLALLMVGTRGWGHVSGVRETVDRLAAALRDSGR